MAMTENSHDENNVFSSQTSQPPTSQSTSSPLVNRYTIENSYAYTNTTVTAFNINEAINVLGPAKDTIESTDKYKTVAKTAYAVGGITLTGWVAGEGVGILLGGLAAVATAPVSLPAVTMILVGAGLIAAYGLVKEASPYDETSFQGSSYPSGLCGRRGPVPASGGSAVWGCSIDGHQVG